jgi:hypothetical protein
VLLALLLAFFVAPLQEPALLPGGVRDANALYPCARAEKVVRFFHLETDEAELDKVRPALSELGSEIRYGPRTTSGWPGHSFVALTTPPDADPKKLAAALKKGGGAAEELVCIAFDGRTGKEELGLTGYGVSKRDLVRGISGDVVWYEATGAWSQFYGRPGKLKPNELRERYAKLFEPYGGAQLGDVAKERFTWTLARAPEDKLRFEVLKQLEKTRCIESATLDGTTLTITVRLENLSSCAALGKITAAGAPLDEAGAEAPRAAFDPTPIYDILKGKGLVP